jgi:hypothetical protein
MDEHREKGDSGEEGDERVGHDLRGEVGWGKYHRLKSEE